MWSMRFIFKMHMTRFYLCPKLPDGRPSVATLSRTWNSHEWGALCFVEVTDEPAIHRQLAGESGVEQFGSVYESSDRLPSGLKSILGQNGIATGANVLNLAVINAVRKKIVGGDLEDIELPI